jgi:hypothetical protein
MDAIVCTMVDLHQRQCGCNVLQCAWCAVQVRVELEVLMRSELFVESQVRRYKATRCASRWSVEFPTFVYACYYSTVGSDNTCDHLDECGLSTSVCTEYAYDITR